MRQPEPFDPEQLLPDALRRLENPQTDIDRIAKGRGASAIASGQ